MTTAIVPSFEASKALPPAIDSSAAAKVSCCANLGWSVLTLGLQIESRYKERIVQETGKARQIQDTLQSLIQLNGQMPGSENETVLTEETLKQFAELEQRAKITLLQPGEKKVSPVRLNEIKAQIHAHSDRLKTELQTLFSTRIQVAISEMQSFMETMRKTCEAYAQSISRYINQRPQ